MRDHRKIGLLGGTFNPVHLGHLLMARDALEQAILDQVRFIPCAAPPHKQAPDLASPAHRLAMIRAAVRGEPSLAVDDIEIRRGPPSFTVQTLEVLRRRHPQAEFHFIIGGDSLPELPLWKEFHRLATLCRFVVVTRPGFTPGSPPPDARCQFVQGHPCAIASRDIRARLRAGRSIRFLVPDTVFRYIARHNLYNQRIQPSKPVS